jgi:hypothetical protein
MSDSTAHDYPPGVPNRRPRPSPFNLAAGPTAPGAISSITSFEERVRALLLSKTQFSLKDALEQALRDKGAVLINIYRRGPYRAEVLFRYGGQYWTIESEAPFHEQWTQAALDDWLYGDLVDHQLPQQIAQIQSGSLG